MSVYFFFQAEDGIRYTSVTGVQTCALPILTQSGTLPPNSGDFTYSSWVNIDPSTSTSIIVL